MRPQYIFESRRSKPHVTIYIRPHEDLRVPWPIRNEVIEFQIELLLFIKIMRVIHQIQEDLDDTLRSPVVRVGRAVRSIGETKSDSKHLSRELGLGEGGERLQLICSCPELCEGSS